MILLRTLASCALFVFAAPCHAQSGRYDDNVAIAYPNSDARSKSMSDHDNVTAADAVSDPAVLASSVLVIDQTSGAVLFEKNADYSQPIASITKLMTAMVVLKAAQSLDQVLQVTSADAVASRPTHSRLQVGAKLSRSELLRLMLMASENRAAAALARYFPGGVRSFVQRMNETANTLGLRATHFADPSGLHPANESTARDLVALVRHAYNCDVIRAYSTTPEYAVSLRRARTTLFHNTNRLTRSGDWEIGLSKTGFISASGQCLVLQAAVSGRPLVMVILDSWGKGGRIEDAMRLRTWLEQRNQRLIVVRS